MASVGLRPTRATFAPLCPTGPKPKTRLDQQKGKQPETPRIWVGTEVPKFSGRSRGVVERAGTSANAVNERERVAIGAKRRAGERTPDPVDLVDRSGLSGRKWTADSSAPLGPLRPLSPLRPLRVRGAVRPLAVSKQPGRKGARPTATDFWSAQAWCYPT
jgi:hypothetical protein